MVTRTRRGRRGRSQVGSTLVAAFLASLGISAVVALVGALVILQPLFVWLGWNVLGFGAAVGLGPLSLWAIALLALFLACHLLARLAIVAVVFLVDPHWYAHRGAAVHFPAPSFRAFVALVLLLVCVSGSGSRRSKQQD